MKKNNKILDAENSSLKNRSSGRRLLRFFGNTILTLFVLSELALTGIGVYGGNLVFDDLSRAKSIKVQILKFTLAMERLFYGLIRNINTDI